VKDFSVECFLHIRNSIATFERFPGFVPLVLLVRATCWKRRVWRNGGIIL